MVFIQDRRIARRGDSAARGAMSLFSTSAKVRRDKIRAVSGVAMIDSFCLENSTRAEREMKMTGALLRARLEAKEMASIGGELSERG